MASLAFRIVNVFTQGDARLTGNPLCVFEDGSGLNDATMQALARQFNLSETTFILPPSQKANARVRIFTPDYEMPFAGHPTLGSAHVCRALGLGGDSLTLQLQAGLIPVTADGDDWTLEARAPVSREVDVSRRDLAAALQLAESDIGERPLWVSTGKEQLIVPLCSEDAVRRAKPDSAKFAHIVNEDGHAHAYVFAPAGPDRLLSRFFFSGNGALLEDPATGSATANLGGWVAAMNRPLPAKFQISQGEYAGRPSTLRLEVTTGPRIFVSGRAIEIGRGSVAL